MNKQMINDAKKYLKRYEFFRKRIDNSEIIKSVFNQDFSEDNSSDMLSYIQLVETSLKQLKKEEKNILIDVFLKRKHRTEFNYSCASFYRLLNRACSNFFYSMGIMYQTNPC
ncbi:MG284/MPN403 family protein [Mycoplasma bradburyae]|uniref:Uncharacterized protein n=1 Tax=Mycoplasma bradburyae TaxID=2963128 RepID=A0AAW6HPC8_9MOLU|nr:hypothetical protein [Mycoplasma bradburyae]MDC4163512.1 hypothetical protein [Mycoplasma bradburyae]MDC4182111.1 hypothetical protein [Mycoplasma bradburyae]MDC4182876.1 hypothetical protein [Mycoplasma bradburyae]MDC4183559.1 hypothetical protein [Mycoplasma bradburyae]MDC4184297.1 hypothetical protein [Mycoplasma bradburyae]